MGRIEFSAQLVDSSTPVYSPTDDRKGRLALSSCNPLLRHLEPTFAVPSGVPERPPELSLFFPECARLGSITKCAEEPRPECQNHQDHVGGIGTLINAQIEAEIEASGLTEIHPGLDEHNAIGKSEQRLLDRDDSHEPRATRLRHDPVEFTRRLAPSKLHYSFTRSRF